MFKQLGLIGCGLIGGSFSLALKEAGRVERVCGFSATQKTTLMAKELGVIDEICGSPAHAVEGSDLVLIAVPVQAVESCLKEIAPHLQKGCLVMDVGSTKEDIARAAKKCLGEKVSQFVPTHPIAGKELSGVAHATKDLFKDRPLILTPLEQTHKALIDRAHQVWTLLGSKVHQMSPQDHDIAFAAVSHLPHLIAFAYMNALVKQSEHEQFLSVAGPGFRDFSRIAGSDPKVWRDIFFSNSVNLQNQLTQFKTEIERLELLIKSENSEELIKAIEISKFTRNQWTINS
jgi:prephenate dehydrogenase